MIKSTYAPCIKHVRVVCASGIK